MTSLPACFACAALFRAGVRLPRRRRPGEARQPGLQNLVTSMNFAPRRDDFFTRVLRTRGRGCAAGFFVARASHATPDFAKAFDCHASDPMGKPASLVCKICGPL